MAENVKHTKLEVVNAHADHLLVRAFDQQALTMFPLYNEQLPTATVEAAQQPFDEMAGEQHPAKSETLHLFIVRGDLRESDARMLCDMAQDMVAPRAAHRTEV